MDDTAAFVIAGGQSSRMGRDKAFLTLSGSTLLERSVELARSVTDNVKVVGRRERFNSAVPQFGNSAILEGVEIIEDVYPGQGPLAGIHAALSGSAFELNLMIGVDTPFLDPRFVQYLVEQAKASGAVVTVPVVGDRLSVIGENSPQPSALSCHPTENRSPDHPIAFPIARSPDHPIARSPDTQPQPLCAVYRREFAPVAENALRQGRNNIVPLFAKVTTREISDVEMLELAFDPRMFDNLNTPEEWEQACRRATR